STGVLLIQLGTPAAPTAGALKPYLRQFLGDPRVIEAPRLLWWFILNLRILPTRPAQSAAKYARIWDRETGSPLLHYTRRQAADLRPPRLPGRLRHHRPRAAGPARLGAGTLRHQLPRHPHQLRPRRRPLRHPGQADHRPARRAPRLAAAAVDAVVPVAVRPRR